MPVLSSAGKSLNLCLWDFCGDPFYLYPHYMFHEQPSITVLTFSMPDYSAQNFAQQVSVRIVLTSRSAIFLALFVTVVCGDLLVSLSFWFFVVVAFFFFFFFCFFFLGGGGGGVYFVVFCYCCCCCCCCDAFCFVFCFWIVCLFGLVVVLRLFVSVCLL